jgi:hypothetical protein
MIASFFAKGEDSYKQAYDERHIFHCDDIHLALMLLCYHARRKARRVAPNTSLSALSLLRRAPFSSARRRATLPLHS